MPQKLDKTDSSFELLHAADAVSHNAYSKYSNFSVGAAVRTRIGKTYVGCNVENASYPITTCAERNAISAAIAAEGPDVQIVEIAISAHNGSIASPCSPCGACRQAICEIAPGANVVFLDNDLEPVRATAEELLPGGFNFKRAG